MRKRAQPTTSRRPGTATSRPGSSASTRSNSSNSSTDSNALAGNNIKRHTSSALGYFKPISSGSGAGTSSILARPPSQRILTFEDIDFLPNNAEIDARCDPKLYSTEVTLSEEYSRKEIDKTAKEDLIKKYCSNPTFRKDPSKCALLIIPFFAFYFFCQIGPS